jgi:predicted nucleic acid-binding protein
MITVFFDTNVIIDVVTRREPFVAASSALLTHAEKGTLKGIVSAITFNNLYYIVRREAGEAKARQAVSFLRSICRIVPLDARIIGMAIDAKIADFEDAIQFFSAVEGRAGYIVTRNSQDFPQDLLPVLTPEALLTLGIGKS